MRGWRPRALLALAVAAALMIGLSLPLFVFPATDEPGRADAVVVFAGGDGERQEEGLRLVREGVAPALVISDGGLPGSRNARVCRERGAALIVGANSVEAVRALRDRPQVSAALSLVPPFLRPGEAGVVAYFEALAAASPVPVIIPMMPP